MNVNIDWCENSIPSLFAFNRMFTLRKGNVPVKVIVLSGRPDDIAYAIDMENEAFYNKGLIENKKPITDKNDTNTQQLYFLEDMEGVVPQLGSIYFVKNVPKDIKCNQFDATGAYMPGRFDYSELIALLGFNGLTNETIWGLSFELELQHRVKEDINDVINRTMLSHFERTGDNTFYENDFNWVVTESADIASITPAVTAEHTASVLKTVETVPVQIEAPAPARTATEADSKEKKTVKRKNFIHGLAEIKRNNQVVQKNSKTEQKTDIDAIAPTPVTKKAAPTFIVKENLSDEEKSSNMASLEDIKSKYIECIDYINSVGNSQFVIIRNAMKDCINKEQFNQQFTKMYLSISDDTSTDLYAHLYDIDVATARYQKTIIHQAVHLGCAFCGNEWDEDITFMETGMHFIQCPKCFADRPFDKEN